MPDYRKTREEQPDFPLEMDQLRSWDPRYTPLDRIGGPGAGGAANETMGLQLANVGALNNEASWIPEGSGVRVDPRSFAAGTVPNYINADDDALKHPGQQILEGLGKTGRAVGDDLSSLFNAITPSQERVNDIAMRFQNAHAIGTGQLPMYMQMQHAQQQLAQGQDLFNMKRMQLAQQLQQQQIQQEQHQWKQVFDVFGNQSISEPQQMEMLKHMAKNGHPVAAQAAHAVNEKLLADFKLVQHRLGMEPEEIMDKLQKKEINWHDLAAVVTVEKKNYIQEKESMAHENAQQRKIQEIADLYEKDPSKVPMSQKLQLKEFYTKHNKLDEELQALHLANKGSRLNLQDKELDLAAKQVMPRVGEQIPLADGHVRTPVFDPQTNALKMFDGSKKPLVEVNTAPDATKEAQKRYIDKTSDNYEKLRDAPSALANIEEAKLLVPKAKYFMGPLGETWMEGVKFLNNRLGTNIRTEGVKSAEELRSRIFFNVMENLKKLDASPSQEQQRILQDGLGKLGTDPNALPQMLDAYGDSIRRKVEQHNKEVSGAETRGTKFPFDPRIELPPRMKDGVPLIKEKSEYDKLPSGSTYYKDGVLKRKK